MLRITLLLFCIPFILFNQGCSKDQDENTGTAILGIRLTDAPGNYDAVFIDIQGVEVKGAAGGDVLLNVSAGVYNLLDFVNGIDTLIALGPINAGKISQIRLILGSNNSVVIDNVSYPLSTPSAQQSGLKLNVHETFLPGIAYELLLDFDAHQSIVEMGNGQYSLKPVIRVITNQNSGSITGTIIPNNEICSITADNGTAQYSTYSDSTGEFLLSGVPQGIYTVTITPNPPLNPVVMNAVNVTVGNVTNLGNINL